MSDSNESYSSDLAGSKAKEKPLIAAFLRQATAVIAAERGLNAVSHQKLRTLATHLKMPEEQFHEAMEKLQADEKLPAGLNRYEQEFVTFLRGEFLNLKNGIMTVSMEERAVDLAARKYQILEPRARQLVHDQAESMEIGRISKGDAESYVEELITSRIGDSTSVEEDSRARFYKIGARWGVSQNEVDAIVLETLAENRRLERADESRGVNFAISFLFLLLIGIGAFVTIYAGGYMDDGLGFLVEEETPEVPSRNVEPLIETEQPPEMPKWWAESNFEKLSDAIVKDQPDQQMMIDELSSEDIDVQTAGALKLVSLAQSNSGNSRVSIEALCEFYYNSPERVVVNKIVDRLREDLNLPNSRLTADQEKMQRIYGANRLLSRLTYFPAQDDEPRVLFRRDAIAKVIANEFGSGDLGSKQVEYLETTNRVIAINQWNHLIQTSWSSPGRTSNMIAPLYDLTRTRLQKDELQRLHGRTVMAVLEAEQKYWWDLKPEIENAVRNSNSAAINTWINHYRTINQVEYQEWLGQTVARVCDINPNGKSRDEVAKELEAVRYRINRERFSELISRNEKVQELNRQIISSYRNGQVSPQKIAELAHLTNLNILLAPEDQSSFRFKEFDQLLAKGTPDLPGMTISLLSKEQREENWAAATHSDKRTREEVLQKLEDLEAERSSARITALEQLADVAPRFRDIDYGDASLLAEYYLTKRSNRETLGTEKFLKQFAAWPTFALAVADQVESSEANMDQAMTLAQFFAEGNFQIEDPVEWKAEISKSVFESALRRSQAMTQTVSHESQQWSFLREHITKLYQQRLKHLGDRASGESEPSALVVKMISRLSSGSGQNAGYPVDRAVELVQRQSASQLEELVSLNKIFVKLLSQRITRRWPNQYSAVEQLNLGLERLDEQDRDLATQFLDLEMMLLSLWSVEREAISQRLISR